METIEIIKNPRMEHCYILANYNRRKFSSMEEVRRALPMGVVERCNSVKLKVESPEQNETSGAYKIKKMVVTTLLEEDTFMEVLREFHVDTSKVKRFY